MRRLAVFDCDGTLVDSQHSIVRAMGEAFTSARIEPPSRATVLQVVGLSLAEAMEILLPDADTALHARLAHEYKQAFQAMRAEGLVEEPLYEGIETVIDVLTHDGWLLGVATGKSDRGLKLCLAQHGLTGRFVTLQTADRHPSKPHPAMLEAAMAEAGASPDMTVMIGDTSFDMMMARAAGARALGVAWGYHVPEALHAAGAHAVVSQPLALLSQMALA